jgi:ribosome-associated translation inhibitor RaiA
MQVRRRGAFPAFGRIMSTLAANSRKDLKSRLGRTDTSDTPLAIRSKLGLEDAFRDHVRARLGRGLDPFATRIERGTVRFEDVNGPRGGVDTLCRIKIVVAGEGESVLVEQVGEDAANAFALAVPRVIRAVRRTIDKRGGKAPRATLRGESAPAPRGRQSEAVETIVGRTVGRGDANMQEALDRPEKRRGDALVDTAAEGTTATDRRAGGAHTARRNTKGSDEGMTATLEDSLGKPSRKSTRRSANRQKSATQLERRAAAKVSSPQARAARAKR